MTTPPVSRFPRTPSSNPTLNASSPNSFRCGEESQGVPFSQIAPHTTCQHRAVVPRRTTIRIYWHSEKSCGFSGMATNQMICWKNWCPPSSKKSRTFQAPGKMSCHMKPGLCCTRLSTTWLKGMCFYSFVIQCLKSDIKIMMVFTVKIESKKNKKIY